MRPLHIATALCLSLSAAACLDVPEDGTESLERQQKVTICHIPPGNPANAHTIEVGQPAVQAHLAHGDTLGACGNPPPPPPVCPPGETWDCYSAPLVTDGIGVCQRGTKTCLPDGSGYGACVGEVLPGVEVCGDGLDNDCDRQTDEDCGPTCIPTAEICDGIDNNCEGDVDEGCLCPPGETWDCYSAPLETDGIGTCQRGTKTCNPDGMGYGACVGEITPVPEVCGDGLDNDCDFEIDEGCVCEPGSTVACYDGPAGTEGVGVCTGGVMTCDSSGTGYGACTGSVTPTDEVCGDGLDNDCDFEIDESCVCEAGSTVACYDGPPGTVGLGQCTAGVQTCAPDGSGYGACVGSVGPSAEVCGDRIDNDCDGVADEGCLGDRIWNDRDRDGIQDAGEAGLGGATLILRTGAGSVVSVAVSATDGTYWFAGIPAGNYYIELIPPFSYTLSGADNGGDDTADNDFDGESGATTVFPFSGGTDGTWDGGVYFVIQT